MTNTPELCLVSPVWYSCPHLYQGRQILWLPSHSAKFGTAQKSLRRSDGLEHTAPIVCIAPVEMIDVCQAQR